ncbi:DUF2975 domain-containing protein [Streptomyces sp. BI20]|uniref:DUF2975 domain-containing protein n=1 Tax=Streptomyces sp. BI20 TaxID=3403460 RepID=UPI003C722FC4
MEKITVRALRAVLVALFAGSLAAQGLLIGSTAFDLLSTGPDHDIAPRPLMVTAIIVLGLLALQVILVCVWRLVTMVRRDTVFSPAAFRPVHTVLGALAAAGVLTFALGLILAPGEAVPPGIVLLIGVAGLTILCAALVVLVLRVLLARAGSMRSELESVI